MQSVCWYVIYMHLGVVSMHFSGNVMHVVSRLQRYVNCTRFLVQTFGQEINHSSFCGDWRHFSLLASLWL